MLYKSLRIFGYTRDSEQRKRPDEWGQFWQNGKMSQLDFKSLLAPRVRHYPSDAAKLADLIVHVVGLTLAITGGGIMLGFAIATGRASLIAAISIYAIGMIVMFAMSTAYNFAPAHRRAGLNKYDHAGIFLMIGASYTPFTTQSLTGAWSWAMTGIIWGLVSLCVMAKLLEVKLPQKLWILIYILLGWIAVGAFWPLIGSVYWVSLLLLLIGGIIYTFGVIFHVNKTLEHAKAVWHGHVVTAAGLHWAAIMLGVVLVPV